MSNWASWKKGLCAALVLGGLSTQALATDAVLSINATPNPALPGSPVLLNVVLSDVADLYGFQFSLAFNPAVLQATAVSEGAFLPTGGLTFFGPGTIDNSAGTISFAFDTLLGPIPGVSGSGTLAQISFNVTQAGSSALTFSDVLLLDSAAADLQVQVNNAVLQAVPEPATLLLFGLGLGAIARRRQQALAVAA